MLTTYQQHARTKLIAIVVSVVVIAGIVVFADHIKANSSTADTTLAQTSNSAPTTNTTKTATPTDSTTTSNTTATTTTTNSSGYKDGTFTASSSYYVPHGYENIQVSLTLKDGVVTDASLRNSESDPDSASFQEEFTSAYKSHVVGKKISGLRLSIISGASDTTQGFNDAVSQIASKAQA